MEISDEDDKNDQIKIISANNKDKQHVPEVEGGLYKSLLRLGNAI